MNPSPSRTTPGLIAAGSVIFLLPSVARAEQFNWLMFGILAVVVPTLAAFLTACVLIWMLCPSKFRPLAVALCTVPCSPIYKGTSYWPLWFHLVDGNFRGNALDIIPFVVLNALVAYGLAWLAGRVFPRRAAPQPQPQPGPMVPDLGNAAAIVANDEPLYKGGSPNPDRLGFIPLRMSSGEVPSDETISRAAALIGTPAKFVDLEGYENEIIAAAIEGGEGKIAYVQCRAREARNGFVDINFYIHVRDLDGIDVAWPIESYNPYFGCDVGYMEWIEGSLILIYREKHHTYICRLVPREKPVFRRIADDWVIHERTLGYWHWQEPTVSCMSLPTLAPLRVLYEDEARAQSLLPAKHW